MTNRIHTGLDFDGTVTDVEREALPYADGYKEDVAAHLGLESSELGRIWNQVESEIVAAPAEFGWKDAETGHIVAPATADPLLLTRVTAEQVLSRLRDYPEGLDMDSARVLERALPADAESMHELLEELLKKATQG